MLALLLPHEARAQFAINTDVVLASRNVWRGITRTTRPVVQGAALLAWVPRGWTVTTGVWASFEPFRPEQSDLTQAGATSRLGETDYWVEAHTRRGRLDVRVGHIWYDLRGRRTTVGPGSAFETAEVYAVLTYLPTRLSGVGTGLYWDHDAVDGAFATFDVFRHVPLVQAGDWIVTFTPRMQAGVSVGQAAGDEGDPGYFLDDGLAYVNATAGLYATQQKWWPYVSGTVQYNRDRATQLTRLNGEFTKAKAWLELGISYTAGARPKQ